MQLPNILTAERCLYISGSYDTPQLFDRLVSLLIQNITNVDAKPALDKTHLIEAFLTREKLASTSIGAGVALPHIRSTVIPSTIGAFIHLDHGIDFSAPDNIPVDLFFALLVPEDQSTKHLHTLSFLAEMFSHKEFCAQLRGEKDSSGLYQILCRNLKFLT